ncbi:uncharacterized protein PV06_02907 [Exophiala oligosperma]|uniref:Transcription factor domain-containing protein n=1 Tax=Exophiala oligosperma TaxID=215243 RepID=A0A0D2AXC1_9EURO|nr:uncharacterized protein PV06_02907 [Exophiala oligosperma]KIW44436.1 hypothetical protein PV06_02907 [Exophiala oligosperma]
MLAQTGQSAPSNHCAEPTSCARSPSNGDVEDSSARVAGLTQCVSPAATHSELAACGPLVEQEHVDSSRSSIPPALAEVDGEDFQCFTPGVSPEHESQHKQYYGSAANYREHQDMPLGSLAGQAAQRKARARQLLNSIPVDVHDHFMHCFWTYYNAAWHMISKEAFNLDKENGGGEFYSPLLHLCILALGCRYADTSRSGVQKYACHHYESPLHREARSHIEAEMSIETSIPLMMSALLMADLEGNLRRYSVGWHSYTNVLRARSPSRAWSLFFGRPTAIKQTDLVLSDAMSQGQGAQLSQYVGLEMREQMEIYEAHIKFIELQAKVVNVLDLQAVLSQTSACYNITALDRELSSWYQNLPPNLQWKEENIERAHFSFFLLHQSYQFLLILLHRRFTYMDRASSHYMGQTQRSIDPIVEFSRTICYESAVKIVHMLVAYGRRIEWRRMYISVPQHLAAATTALIACIRVPSFEQACVQHLMTLAEIAEAMSESHSESRRVAILIRITLEKAVSSGHNSNPENRLNTESDSNTDLTNNARNTDEGPTTALQVSNHGSIRGATPLVEEHSGIPAAHDLALPPSQPPANLTKRFALPSGEGDAFSDLFLLPDEYEWPNLDVGNDIFSLT